MLGPRVGNPVAGTAFVLALEVQRPGGDHQRHPVQWLAVGDQAVQGRHDELGKLRRAIGAYALQLVGDGLVGEAFDQRVLVGGQVDARHRGQLRRDVEVHEAAHVLAHQRVVHGLVDEAITLEKAQVGQGQVAAVEQLDLHLFVGRDVVGELHADLLPGGPAADELVFQHPLHEGLADHRPGVLDAVLRGQLLAVRGAGHRGDAIDHGIGKRHVLVDPAGQLLVGQVSEGEQRLARDGAVVRQVIAGHQGKGRNAGGPAPGQGRAEEAEHAPGGVGVAQVVLDGRQLGEELPAAVVDAVAAFGDGQRDDADRRVGELVDQRLRRFLGQQHVVDGADHPYRQVRFVAQFDQGVEIVLAGQGVTHGAVLTAHADSADAPVERQALVHQSVGVDRLVSAVKAANADMGDAGADHVRGVGWQRDSAAKPGELLAIEFHLESPVMARCQAACCKGLATAWPSASKRWQCAGSKSSARVSP